MASVNTQGSVYPANQAYGNAYRYEEPIDPQIPRTYPDPYEHVSQAQGQQHIPQHTAGHEGLAAEAPTASEPKQRLRKACDSCSVRKVKCDETGPPCKSCHALEIPCTFERPSRRRGPPNRHAEAIKRQKLEESQTQSTGSPTHDAAQSLAALSMPPMLSAESICDIDTLQVLIDDYFLYIHPLIPLPHEPTFREAFRNREDKTNMSFLCLIASMMETLVASFPRRARRLFTSDQARQRFPNAGAVIDHCHHVFVEARGTGHLDRPPNLNEAVASYLAGLAAVYNWDINRMRMYFGECVMMIRGLQFHRPPELSETQQNQPVNYIYQESGRRLFWLMFVGAMSGRQLDDPEGDILMPPVAFVEMLPPLPLEVDDQYILANTVQPQPAEIVSELVGFNLNAKIYRAFHVLAAMETAFGTKTVYDWSRQRQVIRHALQSVKAATADAPHELKLVLTDDFGEWPPTSYEDSAYAIQDNAYGQGQYSYPASRRGSLVLPYPKRTVQYEIQKANIYATQLATRSYLVERYWNLYDIHDRAQVSQVHTGERAGSITSSSSPKASNHQMRTPSDTHGIDADEQAMALEREDIVRDLAILLQSINQINMEPNGMSFCHKIRQVASTLLETNRARMNVMPTLDSESVNKYLMQFLDILSKLQRLGSGRIRPGEDSGFRNAEEVEDEELVHWASLKEHQEKFVRREEIMIAR